MNKDWNEGSFTHIAQQNTVEYPLDVHHVHNILKCTEKKQGLESCLPPSKIAAAAKQGSEKLILPCFSVLHYTVNSSKVPI